MHPHYLADISVSKVGDDRDEVLSPIICKYDVSKE